MAQDHAVEGRNHNGKSIHTIERNTYRLLLEVIVVTGGHGLRRVNHLEGDELESLLLETLDDLSNEVSLDTIGLDGYDWGEMGEKGDHTSEHSSTQAGKKTEGKCHEEHKRCDAQQNIQQKSNHEGENNKTHRHHTPERMIDRYIPMKVRSWSVPATPSGGIAAALTWFMVRTVAEVRAATPTAALTVVLEKPVATVRAAARVATPRLCTRVPVWWRIVAEG